MIGCSPLALCNATHIAVSWDKVDVHFFKGRTADVFQKHVPMKYLVTNLTEKNKLFTRVVRQYDRGNKRKNFSKYS